jgi:putative phosphoribosyl transferase
MVRIEEHMALARTMHVDVTGTYLEGELWLPPDASGVVLFPQAGPERDTCVIGVAERLRKARLGALFLDLLTKEETRSDAYMAAFRFEVHLLTLRLVEATNWLVDQPAIRGLQLGYFGTSFGAVAALRAGAHIPGTVRAIVANNCPERYVQDAMNRQVPPVLAIGGQRAIAFTPRVYGDGRYKSVPGGRLASEKVLRLATNWLTEHLTQPALASAVALRRTAA